MVRERERRGGEREREKPPDQPVKINDLVEVSTGLSVFSYNFVQTEIRSITRKSVD